MANTYTQIHLHLVFAVQNRNSLIQNPWKDRLYEYITGIVQQHKHKMIIINGMPDHLHIVIGMRPIQSLSDLMQDIKGGSSKWINDNKLAVGKFQWQEGYGAFSYNKSLLPKLIDYVKNQEAHHKKKTFLNEYKEFLNAFEVEYDERYIFKELED
ncbi:MAG TPA: IS200/IS605 family transposase [Ferruginibacter sp.]|nr:IS200/IS605 family transposase [Ferruginibacter sp.]